MLPLRGTSTCLSLWLVRFTSSYNTAISNYAKNIELVVVDWVVIGNFKWLACLMGLQGGFKKFTDIFAFGTAKSKPVSLLDQDKEVLEVLEIPHEVL